MDTTVRRTRAGIRVTIGLLVVGPLSLIGAASVAASPETDGPADGT